MRVEGQLLPCPYPDEWGEVQAVRFLNSIALWRDVRAVKFADGRDALYVLLSNYTVRVVVDGRRHWVTAPKGMLTDLASVPRFARSVAGRVGPHLEAAIVHDWLYTAWQDYPERGARKRDKEFADRVFYMGMVESGVPLWQRQAIYQSVRLFGWGAYSSTEEHRFHPMLVEEPHAA